MLAAQYQCDKHVVKLIVESAQLLSTAHHEKNSNKELLDRIYKSTHKNHPCSIWVREDLSHYKWLVEHALSLCWEYTYRYNKIHKTENILNILKNNTPNLSDSNFIEPPKCMPDEFRLEDTVESYRNYYRFKRETINFKYTKRQEPYWL